MIPASEQELVDEYHRYLEQEKLPLWSAEEVLVSGVTRAQWDWLQDFMVRWDKMLNYFHIGRDFSRTPGPRYRSEGMYSGEELREKLAMRIRAASSGRDTFTIDLDGTAGYGTAFLEELFGGLIRVDGIDYDKLQWVLEIKSLEEPYLVADIHGYMKEAQEARLKTLNNLPHY